MKSIEDLEQAIQCLSPGELARFRAWFLEFDAEIWDREITEDAAAGRLDALAEEALSDLRARRASVRE